MPRSAIAEWLTSFAPNPAAPTRQEQLRRCVGALLGIAFTGLATRFAFGEVAPVPMLIAPMGASTVLLFGALESPLAQPWSIMGGNLVAALVGVACAQWIGNPVAAASLAVALAICGMFVCRCVHPPSGAVALTAVLGGPAVHALGFRFVIAPVEFQSLALLSSALVYHALTGRRYPHASHSAGRADAAAVLAPSLSAQRLDDVAGSERWRKSFDDLTCEEIMSTDVQAVPATMKKQAAWELLRQQRTSTLPVVDAAHRVVGMVTHRELGEHASSALHRFWRALRRVVVQQSERVEETVEAVMAAAVHAVHPATPLSRLVPIFTDHAVHEIHVIDEGRRLVGIIRHSDLIRWLHHRAGTESGISAAFPAADSA